MSTSQQRKIIHLDMDAFYASVEQRDRPEYRGRPVIVGGDPHGRGVVAACSYEARRFGIHSAMPAAEALRRCPEGEFIRPRFERYREIAADIFEIYRSATALVEPLSLDEAYLDVSAHASATRLARALKAEVREATGLTVSAGVSYNKFLAKLASDMDKPDGLYVIRPEEGERFVASLPVRKFFGVGPATEARLKAHGIHTGADMRQWSQARLVEVFGKAGAFYHAIARGVDERPLQASRLRKSYGSERTFASDIAAPDEMLDELVHLYEQVRSGLAARRLDARTLTLKVKLTDFRIITRGQTLAGGLGALAAPRALLAELLARARLEGRAVRLLGVTASGLADAAAPQRSQLVLFDELRR